MSETLSVTEPATVPEWLPALRESIDHWEIMARIGYGAERSEYKLGIAVSLDIPTSSNCALCRKYASYKRFQLWCDGCPIMEKTGLRDCATTPYEDAYLAWEARDQKQFKAAARREVEFLKSLLPS